MRILYHSGSPNVNTGYGRATREIAPRLHNGDHEVAVQTMSSVTNMPIWWHGEEFSGELESPIKLYDGTVQNWGLSKVQSHFEDFDADFYFTHFDTWMEPARKSIPKFGIPYGSYVIIDHYPAPSVAVDQVMNATRVVSMSKFAKDALNEKGIRSVQIPHGVNPDNFYPRDDPPSAIETIKKDGTKKRHSTEDTFIIGMVAANYGDRKHVPEQMQAFKMFLDKVDDSAILYIHTRQSARQGFDLSQIQKELGIPSENLFVARSEDYHNVGDEFLNGWYNTFDVFLNCSRGESWGFTLTEAQAAGTPVIATNFSSMPEQLGFNKRKDKEFDIAYRERGGVSKTPHGVVVEPVVGIFREKVAGKHYLAHPSDIFEALKYYYWEEDRRIEDGKAAAEYVRNNYTWEEHIVPKFHQLFAEIEEEIL